MTISLDSPYALLIFGFICAIPIVLIGLFILYKLKIFNVLKQDRPNLLDRNDEVTSDKSEGNPNNDAIPSSFTKNKLPFTGCAFLFTSFACLIILPFSFILTLGMGMGAGSGNSSIPDSFAYVAIIGFMIIIATTIVTGIIGLVLLAVWAVKKFTTPTE